MTDLLSISQFAAEAGKTVQAIYKAIKPGGKLAGYVVTDSGKTMLRREALAVYLGQAPAPEAPAPEPVPQLPQAPPAPEPEPAPEQEAPQAPQELPPMVREYIAFLRKTCLSQAAQIEQLQQAAAQKDAQIAQQQERLQELSDKVAGIAIQAVLAVQQPPKLLPRRGFFRRFFPPGKYQN